MNRILILIILMLILSGFLWQILFYYELVEGATFLQITNGFGRLGGLALLLMNGKFIKAKPYFQIALFFVGLTFIGAVFKILHLPSSDAVMLFGLVVVPVTYLIHFFRKVNKTLLDILKVSWVILLYTSTIFVLEHWPSGDELKYGEESLFVLLFGLFAYQYLKEES